MLKRPFVFADRDGTLIRDTGYMFRTSDYARLPGAAEGLRLLQDAGFGIAVVTNQSGIGQPVISERSAMRLVISSTPIGGNLWST